MIEKEFKRLNLKVSEVASYMKVSRQTVYNFMKAYNNGDPIRKYTKDFFDKLPTFEHKNDAILYLLT